MNRPVIVRADVDEPPELDLEVDADDAAPGSVLAQLRTRAAAQRQARTLELVVGGAFGESLVIRYRVLDSREWDKYAVLLTPAATAGGTGDLPPMSVLNARMMAAACETVLWRDETGEHDLEVRLDGRLAEMLGHPLAPGMSYSDLGVREVVEGLFASPMAVTAHAGELVQWMQDPSDPGGAEGEA